MNRLNDAGLGEAEKLVVALDFNAALECLVKNRRKGVIERHGLRARLAPVIRFAQFVLLNHGAHGTVND